MRALRWFAVCACLLGMTACVEELDETRVERTRGTLGEEIYKVLCMRLASEAYTDDATGNSARPLCEGGAEPDERATPRLRSFHENRARLVTALDAAMPEDVHDDLKSLLGDILPLYDAPSERLPTQARAAAALLDDLLTDFDSLDALERISSRRGYRPMAYSLGLPKPLVGYPDFHDVATKSLALIDEGGAAHDAWNQMLAVLALEMATAGTNPSPAEDETALEVIRDFAFRRHADLETGTPLWMTRRDRRGVAMPALTGGEIPVPFVDLDGDDLADVDAQLRFIDGAGNVLDVPTPFPTTLSDGVPRDEFGRALRTSGERFYDYVDLDGTALGGLLRESPALFNRESAPLLDVAYGVSAFLGPRVRQSKVYGAATLEYDGPNTAEGAVFDLLHGTGALLHMPELDDGLVVSEKLMRDHEQALAGIVDALWYVDSRTDLYPNANVESPNELLDDVLLFADSVSRPPGLLEALLRAFGDPRAEPLERAFAAMLRNKDFITHGPTAADPAVNAAGEVVSRFDQLRVAVNRFEADSADNESLFQRMLGLMHDLNGVKLCNKPNASLLVLGVAIGDYDECELFEIENAAKFYAECMVGRCEMIYKPALINALNTAAARLGINPDHVMEDLTEIPGMGSHPTPQALNRLIFMPPNPFVQGLIDPPLTRDGALVRDRHAGTIFVFELDGFYEQMRPLVEAFLDYDDDYLDAHAEFGTTPPAWVTHCSDPSPSAPCPRFLMGEMMGMLHVHWASRSNARFQGESRGMPFFSFRDNLVSYEDLVADGLSEGRLLSRLAELNRITDGISARPGVDGIEALSNLVRAAVDPTKSCVGSCGANSLATRDGRRTSMTNLGTRTIPILSPANLLIDAIERMDDALEAEPTRQTRWEEGLRQTLRILLSTIPSGSGAEFENRRGRAIALLSIPFIRERLQRHRDIGDLRMWATSLATRAEDSLADPLFATGLSFLDALQRDEEAKNAFGGLIAYLGDTASADDAYLTALLALGDALQLLDDDASIDPLMRGLSGAVATNARDVAISGGTIDPRGSLLDASLQLVREINELDDRRTLTAVLRNLVAIPPGADETPLETVADVIAEVNRVEPGVGTRMSRDDLRTVMQNVHDFLRDEHRGMERLFRVVQSRELRP